MSDPKEIWLEPECCADPSVGRMWCEHEEPVKCEDEVPWTKYILAVTDHTGMTLVDNGVLQTLEKDAKRYRVYRADIVRFFGVTTDEVDKKYDEFLDDNGI